MYNYENYLSRYLNQAKQELSVSNKLEITTEQAYLKMSKLEPETIYFILKYLSSTQTYNTETTPIQIIALSEENSIETTKNLLAKLGSDHNFDVIKDGTTTVKQEYQSPVVMSNFNEVSYGYRSIIYITGTLYVLKGVCDIENFTIDGVEIDTLGTNVAYSMTGNTQPVGQSNLATTVKNISTLCLSITLPSISDYSTLITKIMNISSGAIADTTFDIAFKINSVKFGYFATGDTHLYYRLQSMSFQTAPNLIPSIQVGFML